MGPLEDLVPYITIVHVSSMSGLK